MDAPEDRKAAAVPVEKYGTEVLCASWNPAASAVTEERLDATRAGRADLSSGDPESFLTQFYRLQGS